MESNKEEIKTQQTQELIDAYLMDKLEGDTLFSFKRQLEASSELRLLVNEQRAIMLAVEEENLRKNLNSYHKEIPKLSKKKRNSRTWLAIAASVLILIGASTWAIFYNTNSPQKVFAKNFKPDPGLPTTMGTLANYEFYHGMVNYKRKEYAEAISQWESLYAASPDNDTLVYFLGVANLANGNVNDAEKYLQTANKHSQSTFYSDTQYYLALTLVKMDKIDEAKDILRKTNSPAAAALLDDLNTL